MVCAPVESILQQRFFGCKRYGGASRHEHRETAVHALTLGGGSLEIQAISCPNLIHAPKRYRLGRALSKREESSHGCRTRTDDTEGA